MELVTSLILKWSRSDRLEGRTTPLSPIFDFLHISFTRRRSVQLFTPPRSERRGQLTPASLDSCMHCIFAAQFRTQGRATTRWEGGEGPGFADIAVAIIEADRCQSPGQQGQI